MPGVSCKRVPVTPNAARVRTISQFAPVPGPIVIAIPSDELTLC